jgi:hypothetical protein
MSLGLRGFLHGLGFLTSVRLPFGCGASGSEAFVSDSIVFIGLSLTGAVVTFITPVRRNSKRELSPN